MNGKNIRLTALARAAQEEKRAERLNRHRARHSNEIHDDWDYSLTEARTPAEAAAIDLAFIRAHGRGPR
jgi:hypothetical protein